MIQQLGCNWRESARERVGNSSTPLFQEGLCEWNYHKYAIRALYKDGKLFFTEQTSWVIQSFE